MSGGFERYLGAVTRTVTEYERDGKLLRKVALARTYATTQADLWDAVTNSERLERWFTPVTGDLELGGRYQLKGNAGGEILVCNPPSHLSLTWEFGGGTSWVEVFLSQDTPDCAMLTLEHSCPVDPHWEEYGPGAVGVGWDLSLIGLEIHLDSDAPSFDGHAWAVSEEGKGFMKGSSQDWCRANIEAGEAPEAAKVQAKKTAAFYTGEATDD